MKKKLMGIEIEILNKIYDNTHDIDDSDIGLTNDISKDQILGYYLEDLARRNYLTLFTGSVDRDKSTSYKGSNIIKIRWSDISFTRLGFEYIENYLAEKKDKKINELLEFAKEQDKKRFAERIIVKEEHQSYLKVLIKTIDDINPIIYIDKEALPILKEYLWSVDIEERVKARTVGPKIVEAKIFKSKRHYSSLYQDIKLMDNILFRDQLNEQKKRTGAEYYVGYENGDNLDKRRKNVKFVRKGNLISDGALNNLLNKITGISTSHEVRINIGKKKVYLMKTTNYEEAIYGAFVLRFLFFGKFFTKPFYNKKKVNRIVFDELVKLLNQYLNNFNCTQFEKGIKEIKEFKFSERFIKNIIEVINRNKEFLAER